MATRLELHEKLCEILGSRNVYYQPPASVRMHYPAIVYERENIQITHADNFPYLHDYAYKITVIDEDPDSELIEKIALLDNCRFSRHFTSDNLNHDVFTLYY